MSVSLCILDQLPFVLIAHIHTFLEVPSHVAWMTSSRQHHTIGSLVQASPQHLRLSDTLSNNVPAVLYRYRPRSLLIQFGPKTDVDRLLTIMAPRLVVVELSAGGYTHYIEPVVDLSFLVHVETLSVWSGFCITSMPPVLSRLYAPVLVLTSRIMKQLQECPQLTHVTIETIADNALETFRNWLPLTTLIEFHICRGWIEPQLSAAPPNVCGAVREMSFADVTALPEDAISRMFFMAVQKCPNIVDLRLVNHRSFSVTHFLRGCESKSPSFLETIRSLNLSFVDTVSILELPRMMALTSLDLSHTNYVKEPVSIAAMCPNLTTLRMKVSSLPTSRAYSLLSKLGVVRQHRWFPHLPNLTDITLFVKPEHAANTVLSFSGLSLKRLGIHTFISQSILSMMIVGEVVPIKSFLDDTFLGHLATFASTLRFLEFDISLSESEKCRIYQHLPLLHNLVFDSSCKK